MGVVGRIRYRGTALLQGGLCCRVAFVAGWPLLQGGRYDRITLRIRQAWSARRICGFKASALPLCAHGWGDGEVPRMACSTLRALARLLLRRG